mmetsp:Transcript_9625/g.29188  ORF Transcript_9625/g.29188 Transcript_9625/m.29188 type:complete len:201 (-) Transcript_9625:34-636(-)
MPGVEGVPHGPAAAGGPFAGVSRLARVRKDERVHGAGVRGRLLEKRFDETRRQVARGRAEAGSTMRVRVGPELGDAVEELVRREFGLVTAGYGSASSPHPAAAASLRSPRGQKPCRGRGVAAIPPQTQARSRPAAASPRSPGPADDAHRRGRGQSPDPRRRTPSWPRCRREPWTRGRGRRRDSSADASPVAAAASLRCPR